MMDLALDLEYARIFPRIYSSNLRRVVHFRAHNSVVASVKFERTIPVAFSEAEGSNYGPAAAEEESRKDFRLDLHNGVAIKVDQLESFLPAKGLSITRMCRRDVVNHIHLFENSFPRIPPSIDTSHWPTP